MEMDTKEKLALEQNNTFSFSYFLAINVLPENSICNNSLVWKVVFRTYEQHVRNMTTRKISFEAVEKRMYNGHWNHFERHIRVHEGWPENMLRSFILLFFFSSKSKDNCNAACVGNNVVKSSPFSIFFSCSGFICFSFFLLVQEVKIYVRARVTNSRSSSASLQIEKYDWNQKIWARMSNTANTHPNKNDHDAIFILCSPQAICWGIMCFLYLAFLPRLIF